MALRTPMRRTALIALINFTLIAASTWILFRFEYPGMCRVALAALVINLVTVRGPVAE